MGGGVAVSDVEPTEAWTKKEMLQRLSDSQRFVLFDYRLTLKNETMNGGVAMATER